MRDPERIKPVLTEVERIWRLYPDMRLGQLLCNIAAWAEQELWDIEEDALVAEITRHIRQAPRARAADRQSIDPPV